MEVRNLGRPSDKHLDEREFDALAHDSGAQAPRHALSPDAVRDAELHVQACPDCRKKLAKYRDVLQRLKDLSVIEFATAGAHCAAADAVEWHEVTSGLWPEFKARQLIVHAATCDHCGPLLRAATNVDDDPTPQEQEFLASLSPSAQPRVQRQPEPVSALQPQPWKWRLDWRVAAPAFALLLMVAVFVAIRASSGPLSGSTFAQFAVATHRQHADGSLLLDVHADSQQLLNQWFKVNVPFPLELPASLPQPDETRPYRLNGARLVRVGAKNAAFIAYQTDSGAVSMMVTPDSVAAASGGVEVHFKKVSFHYRTVEGYKVVTWTAHGLTYALVSQEGNRTQRSCMVCHSAMRDRDLSRTPAPLPETGNVNSHLWQ
jgi:hypothetical protein